VAAIPDAGHGEPVGWHLRNRVETSQLIALFQRKINIFAH
jgi:hypothetical protein